MRELRVGRRLVTLSMVIGIVAMAELGGIRHTAASSAEECLSDYTVGIPDSLASAVISPDSASWVESCGQVDTLGSPPVWGDVTVNPFTGGNTFTYTGNCVRGQLDFSNGETGTFNAGVIEVVGSKGPVFAAYVHPVGVPCQGVQGSTRTWSGSSGFVNVTP